MIRTWLAAALGSIFLAGSSTGAGLPRADKMPMKERPESTTRELGRNASTTRPSIAVDVMCVGNAVNARELTLSTSACTTWPAIIAIAHARTAAKVGGCSVSRVLKPIAKQSLQLFDAIADGINSLFGATILQIPQTIERFPYGYTAHSNGRAVCARQLVGFGDTRPRFFNEVSATEFDANEISAPRVYRNDFLTG
jgi:hypothetical protein